MNRKQKLIISITGITIVMLALLGLTYGYYLTRIQGNTNSNSISITTADLTLKYDDGTSYINLTNIMPGTITDGEDGNPNPKTFTVTNDGSGDVEYSVGIDEVTNTLTRTQDLTYSIICVEKLIDAADTSYSACATTPSNSGEYPKTNSYLFTNQIKQDYIQKYTVIISYANPDEDQSIDMGSTIKGRMQIYALAETIDIKGTVTGASKGDYVQINSNPKTSVIASDGTYKLIGIEPGTHTLKVMNGSTTKGTKEIVVKQGTDAGINSNTITFTATERVATVNITSISTTLGVNITEIKDGKNLLKDAIIASAQKAALESSTTRTAYSETPLTTPLVEISAFKYLPGSPSTTESSYNSWLASTSEYYTYGDTYEFNETTKKYTIKNTNGSTVGVVQGAAALVGKYAVSIYGSLSSTVKSASELSSIYYVVSVDDKNIYYITLNNGIKSNEKYYTYGDTYVINETTGKYTIKNSDGSSLKSVKYDTGYETLKNKYIVSTSGSTSISAVSGEDLSYVYKVSENSTSEILKYYEVINGYESTERLLVPTQDNYGDTYYFRGGVLDNYVLFNNMCFRIVRINGDDSIKLTLAGEVESGATDCTGVTDTSAVIQENIIYGYKNITGLDGKTWYIADYENNTAGTSYISLKESLDTWFDSKFKSNGELISAGLKIKDEIWCLGGNYNYKYAYGDGELLDEEGLNDLYPMYTWNYSARNRFMITKTIDLTCGESEDKITSRVGALTSDEVVLAGGNSYANYTYYLYENAKSGYYWLLSRAHFDYNSDNAFKVYQDGSMAYSNVYTTGYYISIRPAISLLSGTTISSGNGTINNPYVIN